MRNCLLIISLCICVNYIVACATADPVVAPRPPLYALSTPTKFDLLLDENITRDDPRLKSIIYSGISNHATAIITYVNPNASRLANRLARILSQSGVDVDKPQLVARPVSNVHTMDKYVVVSLRFQMLG